MVVVQHCADFSNEVAALEVTRDRLCCPSRRLASSPALDIPKRSGPTWSRRDGV